MKIRGLESGYGSVQILWGVDMSLREGAITALLGPNGAGKSTLLRSIFGTVRPWKGSILYRDEDILHLPPHRKVDRGIALVPEGRHVFAGMTVKENLLLGAYRKRARERMEGNLGLVFSLFPILEERQDQRAGTLSGGEQQMLTIARSLMASPELMMLDEPSQGLAPKVVEEVFSALTRIREEGVTILLVEQNVENVLSIADYVYILNEGRVVGEGRPDEIEKAGLRKAYLGL